MTTPPLQFVIVDDFAEDRAAIRRALRKGMTRHFVCQEAANGEEALELYAQNQIIPSTTDLLLLDLNMPGMNGLEVLQDLKGDSAILPMPVVVLTGAPRDEEANAALAAGAQDFIAKSQITPETLARTVLNAIERFRLVKALHASEERSRRQLAELKAAEGAEREQRRLAEALLASLTALTGSLDVESAMQQLLAHAATVVPSDAGSVILFEEAGGRVAYLRGFAPEAADFFKEYRFPLHDGSSEILPANLQPYLIADTADSPRWVSLPVTDWIRSSVRIPIELHGVIIGLLIADSATPHHFQPTDLEKLRAFAHYASLALEKADHITKLEERVATRTADLRAAKERVEAILDNSLDGILLLHTDLRIEQTNPAFQSLFPGTTATYLNQPLLDLIEPAKKLHVAALLHAVVTEQLGTQIETRMQRQDGTVFDAELSIGPINQTGLVCTLRDITERKGAENQLRESEALYRLLAENITDMVLQYNTTGEFTYVSPSCRPLLGYEPEELLGQHGFHYVHADDITAFQQLNQNVRESPPTVAYITGRFRHKAGHYLWLEFAGRVVRSAETGIIVEAVVSARDITQRKLAEASLRESEARYRLLAENITDMVIRYSATSEFLYVSPSCRMVLGYEPEDLLGRSGLALVHPADMPQVQNSYQAIFNEGRSLPTITCRYRHKAGHYLWLEFALRIIRTPETGVVEEFVVSARDVTMRQQADEALQLALQKEKELGELKSRFISMASHEFRTPLTAIRALTDTLLSYRHRLPDDQIDRRLNKIQAQVDYLKSIIEDVLQLARLQARRVEFALVPIDLDQLCHKVLEELQTQQEETARVVYQCDDQLGAVSLDPKLMRQIITNLISNALKYSPDGKPIMVTLTSSDTEIILQVRDEGIGIPAADLNHLFQPFHRASNVGAIAGTGLGLTITKESVELQGGTLSVTSEVGLGTTFTVYLPFNGKREEDDKNFSN